jgi:hypothetical protein
MEIKGLDINELLEHVQIVNRELGKGKGGERLLEEAFGDFPAIETLYAWMCTIARSKKLDKRSNKRLLRTMERDFLVLLALWHMEKEHENRKPNLKVVGDESGRSKRMN